MFRSLQNLLTRMLAAAIYTFAIAITIVSLLLLLLYNLYKESIDGSYHTTTYTAFLISTLCVSAFFCLLLPLLLIYATFMAISYRNGLDGGRDMHEDRVSLDFISFWQSEACA